LARPVSRRFHEKAGLALTKAGCPTITRPIAPDDCLTPEGVFDLL
jgi:hypothetical protein